MPKLYTKTGDSGKTSLYDGSRIEKDSIIFDVLGNIDELSSHIGLLCAQISSRAMNKPTQKHSSDLDESYKKTLDMYNTDIENIKTLQYPLREIQAKLLNIGSNIAVINPKKKERVPRITEGDVKTLESLIDKCESVNGKLTEFLLPGYEMADAQCHVCRSVSRRTERSLWMLSKSEIDGKLITIDINIFKYMNRLSDFFFAFARNLSDGNDIKVSFIKK